MGSTNRHDVPNNDGVRVDARQQRQCAAQKYRPQRVRLLLIAEAPPSAPDRYFYFENVREHDWLFRAVAQAVLGYTPARTDKAEALAALRDQGYFLIDLSEDPVPFAGAPLDHCVAGLLERVRVLNPNKIILIKANVYDTAYRPLADAGLPVVPIRIPFPSSGQQANFRREFTGALTAQVARTGRAPERPVGSALQEGE